MTIQHIKESITNVIGYYEANPDKTRYADKLATAVLETGLRCRATGPDGGKLISDMPEAIGGGGTAPSPGWLMRAALACCDATVIAMRAAQLGIELTHLEVTVESISDDKGLLGMDEHTYAGPYQVATRVVLNAEGTDPETLREIAAWAEHHSPVADAFRRPVPMQVEVTVGQ